VGGKIDASAPVILNAPVGEKRSPAARIFPFKAHTAVQPYDTENSTLALPNFTENYWVDFDWAKALVEGMKRSGLPYSGKYGFVETRMYSSIHHEVVPARQALGCTDCHSSQAVDCTRCHKGASGRDTPAQRLATYPAVKDRFDFKALGYDSDPALAGGRFTAAIGRGLPAR